MAQLIPPPGELGLGLGLGIRQGELTEGELTGGNLIGGNSSWGNSPRIYIFILFVSASVLFEGVFSM